MGWLFNSQSRDELIQKLIRPHDSDKTSGRNLAHTLRRESGTYVLWSVVEITAKIQGGHRNLAPGESIRYIQCDLLECHDGQWGYKGLEESMEPYYYSCPLSYLAMVEEVRPAWRALVRAWHDSRRKPAASRLVAA